MLRMWVWHKRKTKKYEWICRVFFAFFRFILSNSKIDPVFIFGFIFKGGGSGRNGDDQAFSYAQLQQQQQQ